VNSLNASLTYKNDNFASFVGGFDIIFRDFLQKIPTKQT
jgi:hypothetical protein